MSASVGSPTVDAASAPLESITVDLYRDVHKGIRNELFAVTAQIGNLDPGDAARAAQIGERTRWLFELLDDHAGHEDRHISAVLSTIDSTLDDRVRAEHVRLEAAMADIDRLHVDALNAPSPSRQVAIRRWYLAFASFTSAYLAHEATEELEVMPILTSGIGETGVVELERAIIDAIEPEHFADYLRLILPATNRPERAQLLGGIKAGAPNEVFGAAVIIAEQVLTDVDHTQLLRDLA